jgi:16S rRNA (guanine(966)-N(2))-methyltransferase RsmD
MRITAGAAKGREVPLPGGVALRPTSDKVKQALFNALGPAVAGAEVLDLFCGSGNLGLEALSRGAKTVAFVDREAACLQSARSLASAWGLDPGGTCLYLRMEALQALEGFRRDGRKFDLILADPPYASGLAAGLLALPHLPSLLKPGADSRLVLEHAAKEDLPAPPEGLEAGPRRTYGDTALSSYLLKRAD